MTSSLFSVDNVQQDTKSLAMPPTARVLRVELTQEDPGNDFTFASSSVH